MAAVWDLEAHTKAKHELLRRYLQAWFPILTNSGRTRRVLFLDGFAGPGRYVGGERGSPIIALSTLVDHASFSRLNRTQFVFLFVEPDEERFASLEAELESFWASRPQGRPANVVVHAYNSTFADTAESLLRYLQDQKTSLAPTFAFIDPFGWKGVSLRLISDLLAFDKCEVLFNFMYDSVNRWVASEQQGVARHFDELFGTSEGEHRSAGQMSGDQRKVFLRDLYVRQLSSVGRFKFVRPFELIDVDRGRTAYYLVFGTRHHVGLKVMKEAMWALDPMTGARFSGFADQNQMLFQPEPDLGPLSAAIREHFAGKRTTVDEIERFVIEDTDYKTTHYKRVLKDLEAGKGIVADEVSRRKKNTYPPGTVLHFAATV
jgi:three-Cys-motif partner protein